MPRLFRFRFAQTDSRKLRVREHAERHKPIARGAATAVQVVSDHAEIIERDVSKLRTARAIPHRPHPRRGGVQSLVDFDVATRIQLDSGRFEPDLLRVRSPSNRDQQVATFYRLFSICRFLRAPVRFDLRFPRPFSLVSRAILRSPRSRSFHESLARRRDLPAVATCEPRSMMVTRVPNRRRAWASSRPTYPPPNTITCAGKR